MEPIIFSAFEAFERSIYGPLPRALGLQFDPVDHVVEAYPPLSNYNCYTIAWPNGLRMSNCAEAVLSIALARNWWDTNDTGKGSPPALEAVARGGLTRQEMIRRLQRLHLLKFPVYEFNLPDKFVLISGQPRKDKHAIIFIPADPANGLMNAHWTYSHVEHQDERPPMPPYALVVYTEFPITIDPLDRGVYWRARVTSENKVEYDAAHNLGLACDCDWSMLCEHEFAYVPLRWAQPMVGPMRRITVDGQQHVVGTYHGSVVGTCDQTYKVTTVEECGVKVRAPGGRVTVRPWTNGTPVVRRTTYASRIANFFKQNVYAGTEPPERINCPPLILSIQRLRDDDEVDSITSASIPRFFKRCLFEVSGARTQSITELEYDVPRLAYGTTDDLTLRLPRKQELLSRLMLRKEVTQDTVLDLVRRMAAEEKWCVDIDDDEFRIWLKRVVTEKGLAEQPKLPPDCCWNCLQRVKTYRHMCKTCKRRSMEMKPEPLLLWDTAITHVGFRPLWSCDFTLPNVALKRDVVITNRKTVLYKYGHNGSLDMQQLVALFRREMGALSCRGYSRGPVILGQEPKCFPRGHGTACLAFLVRLGMERAHEGQDWVYDICFKYLEEQRICEVIPESWEAFIARYSGEKKQKNEDGRKEEAEGWAPRLMDPMATTHPDQDIQVPVTMSGFPKAEKSMGVELKPDLYFADKATEKPRFICSPNPVVLARLGRWTHAQTKWLAHKFTWKHNLYYAGCSTPEELNLWLNRTLAEIPDPYSLVDDISAMDSNHSRASFAFHRRVRHVQFRHISEYIEGLYNGEEVLRIRVGNYVLEVSYVNASGVSDTSYKNSLPCLLIRCLAILHAFVDIDTLSDVVSAMNEVVRVCAIAASGDDGIARLPSVVCGVPISCFSLERYRAIWAAAGFPVKVQLIPPVRWRMATFLAMRPVWAGKRYEWAPEPARRMRGMFWQLDNSMHPIAWARGIASQVLQQSRAVPVLSDICEWYLRNTHGPIADVSATNQYSPFYGSVMSGGPNSRALREFCADYHVTSADIERFKRMLDQTTDVLVNLEAFVLYRIYQEES